jgi:hypothetical protein
MLNSKHAFAAAAIALGAFLAAPSAEADSRIFSVKTTQPGVTIEQASRDGQPLAIAGRDTVATLFRIDSPAAAVPCSNHLLFTVSTGEQIDRIVDLCANNWQLTLAVGGVTTGPRNQIVTIATDDPGVGINEVYLERQPVPIVSRVGNAVRVQLNGGSAGVQCARDLGLALSDGRRIARGVNICNANWSLVVALVGDTGAPPAALPPANPPPVAPPPPSAGGMVWSSASDSGGATLAYGIPRTEGGEFFAACELGSDQIDLGLARIATGVRPGGGVFVTFSAGTFRNTYSAVGSPPDQMTGVSHPQLTLSAADPLWPAMIHGSVLSVAIGSAPAYAIPLAGSGVPAQNFLAVCQPQATANPPIVANPPPPGTLSCADEGSIRSSAGDTPSVIVFHNLLDRPVWVYWLNFQGGRKPIRTLAPGETVSQDTYLGHAWLAADEAGRCLNVFLAPVGQGDAIIPGG